MAEIHVALLLDDKLKEKEESLITNQNYKKKIKERAKIIVKKIMEEFQNNNKS